MAEFLKIPFENIKKIQLVGGEKARTLRTLVKQFSEKPDYVFNAGHFDNGAKSETYGITVSDTIVNGEAINTSTSENTEDSNWKYNDGIYTNMGIAFNDNGEIEMTTTANAYKKKYNSFIGGSPHLLDSGSRSNKLKTAFGNQKVYRIAMGFNDNQLIVGFPKEKMTLTKLTDFMQEQGAAHAIALDGGGSINVCQHVNGKYNHLDTHNYNRAVSTFVCVWLKENDNKDTGVTVEDIPEYEGEKAIGVYEIVWKSVNRRVGSGLNYALAGDALKKGDRITVFKKHGTWLYSYGYWISANATKLVKTY